MLVKWCQETSISQWILCILAAILASDLLVIAMLFPDNGWSSAAKNSWATWWFPAVYFSSSVRSHGVVIRGITGAEWYVTGWGPCLSSLLSIKSRSKPSNEANDLLKKKMCGILYIYAKALFQCHIGVFHMRKRFNLSNICFKLGQVNVYCTFRK